MANLIKRPIVVQDLIDRATYIAANNLDAGDRFLMLPKPLFNGLQNYLRSANSAASVILNSLIFGNIQLKASETI